MLPTKKILAVIPARQGSKGLPGKNLAHVGPYSLVQHAVMAARESSLVTHLRVSTDSEEIKESAEEIGVEVPWFRSARLATDQASSVDVVLDAMEQEAGLPGGFDVVVLLEPTAPLRRPKDVDNVIGILLRDWSDTDACMTVVPANFHPSAILSVDAASQFLMPYSRAFPRIESRRQDGPQAYLPIGNCFAIKAEVLMTTKTFYPEKLRPYILEPCQSIEIDVAQDLLLARQVWNTEKFGWP